MNSKVFLIILLSFNIIHVVYGQKLKVNIKYSKLTATYNFIQKLSDYYPDNDYKQIFQKSSYNTTEFTNLITQLDTLNLYESLSFQDYPYGQKQPFQTISLIEKNLINATTIDDFNSRTFGILPNDKIFAFSHIISKFVPVYQELIYLPNESKFDKKMQELTKYVENVNLSEYFDIGLHFYGTIWDYSVPIDIAIIPTIEEGGFTASAFFNNAVSEVPINFNQNDILFCVLTHEIFHLLYDGQSLQLKQDIQKWVSKNPSVNSQYAYLLLDEALATALGNGYVYEGINNVTDKEDWYNVKYINLMAQKIYPLIKEYIGKKKTIDQFFINQYIKIYDENFSDWTNELEHIFTYRYILTDNPEDFNYFRKNYRYVNKSFSESPINSNGLEKLKEAPMTKIVIISKNNKKMLSTIKSTFSELKNWSYKAKEEFIYTQFLNDKTKLIIVNITEGDFAKLLEDSFKNGKIN